MEQSSSSSLLLDPKLLLIEAGLKKGEVVADFGCGNVGHVIFPAAKLVEEEGGAYAIDIQKHVISAIESVRRQKGLANLISLWGDFERSNGVRVSEKTFDVSFLVNNLYLAKKKEVMAEEIRRTTKINGRLVVIDWAKESLPLGPPLSERVVPEEAIALFKSHGFELNHPFIAGPSHWGLVFHRAT